MEDYDYVHLQGKEEFEKNQKQLLEKGNITRQSKAQLEQQQGKEEFEKNQKQLLEKGNITRQSKAQLEQQQIKQFERLEHEVSQPINHDMSGWVPQQQQQQQQQQHPHSHHPHPTPTTTTTNPPAGSAPKLCPGDRSSSSSTRSSALAEVRARVAQSSNALCDKLKEIVLSTKTAALRYPAAGRGPRHDGARARAHGVHAALQDAAGPARRHVMLMLM
ncbi:hypothetical protein CRUP_018591 [Coryphaenoides rupestris]|nr:hypothetical protein CRUP_018591 [Coryphaenoides rupestris]